MDTQGPGTDHSDVFTSECAPLLNGINVNQVEPFNICSAVPFLAEVLQKNGPLPREALYLGQAEDDLPVLLNLHDPLPGPLLILGKSEFGKTNFLRMVAQFVILTHSPQEIQFGVLTDRADEWPESLTETPPCVGVFSSQGFGGARFAESLSMWTSQNRKKGQSVLFLIDGIESIFEWSQSARACLQNIFTNGPQKGVWPLVTLDLRNCEQMNDWLEYFHLRIFEQGRALGNSKTWFSIKEELGWTRFWLPALNPY